MPFTRISVPQATTPEQKQAIAHGVHQAMVDNIGIPQDDFFQLISVYKPEDFFFDANFLGIERSCDLVVIQITLRRGRSDAMKQSLFASVTENLKQHADIRPQDVFVYLSENDFSDWSVGNGQMSMKIVQQRDDYN